MAAVTARNSKGRARAAAVPLYSSKIIKAGALLRHQDAAGSLGRDRLGSGEHRAPLWELAPWKETKNYWDELLEGKYEWSSIGKQLRQKGG